MDDEAAISFVRAVIAAYDQPDPGTGERNPVVYWNWMTASSLTHHAQPPEGWPPYDEALIGELQRAGMLDVDGWGDKPRRLSPTERGRTLVTTRDRAMSEDPVAPIAEILAALAAQTASGNKLAWPAVRPVLAALRNYWEAGGFAPNGVAVPAILHAIDDRDEPMFRATVSQLINGGYLRAGSTITANGIPIEVALTDRAHGILDGWPGATPEQLVENLIAVLSAAAAAEPDEKKKGKLLGVLETIRELGVDVASDVLAKVLLGR